MTTFHLYKSDKRDKKYVMTMPKLKHKHYFGQENYRDFTLMNKKTSKFYEPDIKQREKIRTAYLRRHAKNKKNIHSPSSMSDIILWSAPTLQQGIKNFEKRYKVNIIYHNYIYNGE
jgi:hypothetical protein